MRQRRQDGEVVGRDAVDPERSECVGSMNRVDRPGLDPEMASDEIVDGGSVEESLCDGDTLDCRIDGSAEEGCEVAG